MKLRHIIIILLLALVVSSGYLLAKYFMPGNMAVNTKRKTPTTRVDKTIDLVYVATRGKDIYYHQDECTKLGVGGRPLPLKEARDQGYKPCPVCN